MFDTRTVQRLKSRIRRNPVTGCWLWTDLRNESGYAHAHVVLANGKTTNMGVHRVMYLLHVGKIPEGHVLDHLCQVKHCVNPDHVQPVSVAENCRRSVAAGDRKVDLTTYSGHGRTYREFCRKKRAEWLAKKADRTGDQSAA